MHAANGLPVMVVDHRGRPQWHEVFEGSPYILRRQTQARINRVLSSSGHRPYIGMKTVARWLWNPYQPKAAEMFFSAEEIAFAEPYRGMVMIEPNVKANNHSNKAWAKGRWPQVVSALPDVEFVQCVSGSVKLNDVTLIAAPTFRHACAVLSVCRAFVGTEGGLHHAAAAVKTPAVILWSEFIHPSITGYRTQVNLRHAGNPCGMRVNCRGCQKSMEAITVTEVVAALKGVLR